MQGVRSGCLRLSAALVRHGLISARDAERILGSPATQPVTPGGEAADPVTRPLQEPSEVRGDERLSGLFNEISERQDLRRHELGDGEAPPGRDEHHQDRPFEAELPPLETEPGFEPPHTPVVRDYLCFLPPPAGRLIPRTGALPEVGDVLDFERGEFEVMQIGRSPVPDDQRPCIYLHRRQ
jgi:hypothetical protein